MPPTQTCPRCGRANSTVNSFCAGCGANLASQTNGNGWKVFFGAFALFAGMVWAAVIYTGTTPSSPAAQSPSQSLVGSRVTPEPASQNLASKSAQHLAEAKQALADGYKPDRDPKKASWGDVAGAKRHLKAIAPSDPEYREAQELLKEVARRERQTELASRRPAASPASDDVDTADGDAEDEDEADSASTDSAAARTGGRSSLSAGRSAGNSSDDYYTNSDGVRVHRPVHSNSGPPAGATAQCRDGSYSFSLHRSGTCSHHGGVAKWL